MRAFTLVLLVLSVAAAAVAVGQYYVPRAYYTIDNDGHQTAPVPLRRLRRSLHRGHNGVSASASASASSDSYDGGDDANAHARASSSGSSGNWYPGGGYFPGGGADWAGGHGHGFVHPGLGYN